MRYNSLKCIFSFKIINISAPTILQDPLMTLYLSLNVFTFGCFEVSMKSQTAILNPLVSMLSTRLLMSSGKYRLISCRLHCWKTDIIQQLPFPLVSLSILKGSLLSSIRLMSSFATDLSKWKFSKMILRKGKIGINTR